MYIDTFYELIILSFVVILNRIIKVICQYATYYAFILSF